MVYRVHVTIEIGPFSSRFYLGAILCIVKCSLSKLIATSAVYVLDANTYRDHDSHCATTQC